MAPGDCYAIGCRARVLPTIVFCEKHAAMVQSDTLKVLDRTFKGRRKPSQVFEVALAIAQQEIVFCQTYGYRMPAQSGFEW